MPRCYSYEETKEQDEAKEARLSSLVSAADPRFACARRGEAKYQGRGRKQQGKGTRESAAASASEARRGRNANRSLPAGVLRANRYPGASIRPYFVPVGPLLAAAAVAVVVVVVVVVVAVVVAVLVITLAVSREFSIARWWRVAELPR